MMFIDPEEIREFLQSPTACALFGSDFEQMKAVLCFAIGGLNIIPELARKLGISEATLFRLARHSGTKNSHILDWLKDPRSAEFFGESFTLKACVLRAMINGECLADIGRQHGVSRSAVSKQARRAMAIYGVDFRLTQTEL